MKLALLFILTCITLVASEKTITVLTRNAPTTFYYAVDNSKTGFEYDLVLAFAKAKNYKIKLVVKNSIDSVINSLEKGEGDIAAAGLTATDKRAKTFLFTPSYYDVQEQVVCAYKKKPKNPEDLQNYSIQVIKNSSYVESLLRLKKEYPNLIWSEHLGYTTEHIFDLLDKKKFDCSVADSNIVAINRRYFPHLHVAFGISDVQKLTWLLPKSKKNSQLYKDLNAWFKTFKSSKEFLRIKDKYFSHVEIFDYVDIATYHKRIKKRLPTYIGSFQRGAAKYKLDWRLLAAQAYQESHWNPKAKSPTGVRGMMMLTLPTAKELGVTNRLNYRHSIEGGAKYISKLYKRIPKEVKSNRDRYIFALAGYNIGMGHMYDAMRLGKKLGINPYTWVNMKTLLPKLSERKYYKGLRYGYARGMEPVKYVDRIHNYFDILKQYYPKK